MDQEITTDELIFEYLYAKKYKKSLEYFSLESGIIRTISADVDKDLEKKLRKKIISYLLSSSDIIVNELISPVRKIENALIELNSIIKTVIPNDGTSVKNNIRPINSSFVPTVNEHSASSSYVQNHGKYSNYDKKDHIRKTPNPKNHSLATATVPQQSTVTITDDDPFTIAIFEPEKWNQVVDQHVNHSIVPDTVAEMINNCYVGQQKPDINFAVEAMQGNQELMQELQSLLTDYCATEETAPPMIFEENNFDDLFPSLQFSNHSDEACVNSSIFSDVPVVGPVLPSSNYNYDNNIQQSQTLSEDLVKSIRNEEMNKKPCTNNNIVPSHVVKALFVSNDSPQTSNQNNNVPKNRSEIISSNEDYQPRKRSKGITETGEIKIVYKKPLNFTSSPATKEKDNVSCQRLEPNLKTTNGGGCKIKRPRLEKKFHVPADRMEAVLKKLHNKM